MANILLVEDDSDYSETIEAMLSLRGHSVEPVPTGLEALEHMRMGSYEIVLLDWHLPDMNGIDVLREFRSEGGVTPVVMLTGETDGKQLAEVRQAGANDCLSKTSNIEELFKRIEMLTGDQSQDSSL